MFLARVFGRPHRSNNFARLEVRSGGWLLNSFTVPLARILADCVVTSGKRVTAVKDCVARRSFAWTFTPPCAHEVAGNSYAAGGRSMTADTGFPAEAPASTFLTAALLFIALR
jgi:hypothetical protein